MKDIDTKILEGMYEQISGQQPEPLVLIKEDYDPKYKIILEGLVDQLGGAGSPTAIDTARRLIGLITRDIPACQDNSACLKALDNKAIMIINTIKKLDNPMLSRILSQYEDIAPTSQIKIIYQLLTK